METSAYRFRTGYPFQRRFLERGIIFRTHESSSFVSSHLKLFKDRLPLNIRLNELTSKLLYSCRTLERSIKNWPISRTGYLFQGKLFLERGANFESRAAHTHLKNIQVPPRDWFEVLSNLKDSAFKAVKRDAKFKTYRCVKGVPFANGKYTKGVPFLPECYIKG